MTKRSLIRAVTLTMALALWSATSPPSAEAGPTVYISVLDGTNGNLFGTLNLATGSFSQIAALALPT
jgi:hypothetical protein